MSDSDRLAVIIKHTSFIWTHLKRSEPEPWYEMSSKNQTMAVVTVKWGKFMSMKSMVDSLYTAPPRNILKTCQRFIPKALLPVTTNRITQDSLHFDGSKYRDPKFRWFHKFLLHRSYTRRRYHPKGVDFVVWGPKCTFGIGGTWIWREWFLLMLVFYGQLRIWILLTPWFGVFFITEKLRVSHLWEGRKWFAWMFLGYTGVIIGHQPKQFTITREIPQMYHTFVLLDRPKMGPISTFTRLWHLGKHRHARFHAATTKKQASHSVEFGTNSIPYLFTKITQKRAQQTRITTELHHQVNMAPNNCNVLHNLDVQSHSPVC